MVIESITQFTKGFTMNRQIGSKLVLVVALLVANRATVSAQLPKSGPWDSTALKAVEVKPEWGEVRGKARERSRSIYAQGVAVSGPARIKLP